MPLLSTAEAAMHLCIGTDLLLSFTEKCPKPKQARLLKSQEQAGQRFFDQKELDGYRSFLVEPWPKPPSGKRPSVPKCIRDDVSAECHYGCAVCGRMDNGELAHIRPVAKTLDNSPYNLILLCPNHHTSYDHGFRPAANLKLDEIEAAKLMKSRSRRRVQLYEANAVRAIGAILQLIADLQNKAKSSDEPVPVQVIETELRFLLKSLPSLLEKAESLAKKDLELNEVDKKLTKLVPKLRTAIQGVQQLSKPKATRTMAAEVSEHARAVVIALDEVQCPHCEGQGQYGIVGVLCRYCHGECMISSARAEAYSPSEVDELACPHCEGQGQSGLVGDLCRYCAGACFVTQAVADEYDADDIDEVECPRCQGHGTYGLSGDLCRYCGGSCFVSAARAEAYEEDAIDAVLCPHCSGQGTTGLVGDICAYCRGACEITSQRANEYDPDDIDEVTCPHCHGQGRYAGGTVCRVCRGSCVVRRAEAEEYDREEIDEVECPRCGGTGATGIGGTYQCKLCRGDGIVSGEDRAQYLAALRQRDQ